MNIHEFDDTLGTIGHGNHFAELQEIDEIVDEGLFNEMGGMRIIVVDDT